VVGTDDEGDGLDACVVEPVDDVPKGPQRGATKAVYRALVEALIDFGEVPPACSHISPATRCVEANKWRTMADNRSISKSDDKTPGAVPSSAQRTSCRTWA